MITLTEQDSLVFFFCFQVVFVVQYFKKRRATLPVSHSDAGTADTEEASPQMNHSVETCDKYVMSQVNDTHYTFTHGGFQFRLIMSLTLHRLNIIAAGSQT